MTLELSPGTTPIEGVAFSNDAGTMIEVVCPANPLPVYLTVAPVVDQNVNIDEVAGIAVKTGAGTASGSLRVELPTDGTGKVGLNAGSALVGSVSIDQTTPGTTNAVSTTPVKSTTVTTNQVTVPATANGILILAANANRKGAEISNPNAVTVYWSQQATGLTTSNGDAIPAGGSLVIDTPLYTGAIYGIVAAATQVVTYAEYTA